MRAISTRPRFFSENGIAYVFAKQPFQGRTLQFTDPFGFQIELYASMEKRPHLLRRYDLYKGCHPQRLDHFNVFAAEVQDTVDFYARLGFRLTEYGEEDGPNGRIAAAWLHRKGNVHDFAITNGKGPRLHHFAYWVPTAMNILHLCDVMASAAISKTSNAALAATAFPTRSFFTSGIPTATGWSFTPAITLPWTTITSRCAGR